MQAVDAESLQRLVPLLDSEQFSPEVYRKAGVFVLRRALPAREVDLWQSAWREFAQSLGAGREVNPFNPVVLNEAVPPLLAEIHRCAALLDVMQRVYPDLAFYQQRFLIKDAGSRAPVFLHQDVSYDHGWPEKTSVFVALSPASADNGGLLLYPGTHTLGYMGDTGEIDPAILPSGWPTLCPSLEPGDVALMHECAWHGSLPHVRGPDRILVQITYQPADDPSGAALLRGAWGAAFPPGGLPREKFFKRSRASRLRELQAEVDRLKAIGTDSNAAKGFKPPDGDVGV